MWTSNIYIKNLHKTYTLFTATYIYQKLFEAGCVGT